MNSKKLFFWLVVGVLVLGGIFFVAERFYRQTVALNSIATTPQTPAKVKVVATLFPWYDMTRAIGGDRVDVSLVLPPGVDPHSFEPTPSDFTAIDASDIFMYTGKAMEPWADDIARNAAPQTTVIDASEGIDLLPVAVPDPDEPDQTVDPHFWLNPDNTVQVAERVAKILIEKDPAGTQTYQQNELAYETQLKTLDETYRKTLSTCQTKTIVYGGHYAFGYLAKRYGLQYQAAEGLSPDAEPSAKTLAILVDQIRREHIGTIFAEELASSKVTETLAQETLTKILLLNPGENVTKDEFDQGITLTQILENNLQNFKHGLRCGN